MRAAGRGLSGGALRPSEPVAAPPGPDGLPEPPGAAPRGAAPPRSPSPQEKSRQSTHSTERIYNRPPGHLRTRVLQPLHRGQAVPSVPPARRRLAHAAWLRPDGALRAATLLTAAPGRQPRFGGKPGKETPHPDRAGETSPSAEGSGGLRPPRARWPMPQQAGGPAGPALPRAPSPGSSLLLGINVIFARELFVASSNCTWQSHSASYRYG